MVIMKSKTQERKLMSLKKKLSLLVALGVTSNLSSVNLADDCGAVSVSSSFSASDNFTKDSINELNKEKRYLKSLEMKKTRSVIDYNQTIDYMNTLIRTNLSYEKLIRINSHQDNDFFDESMIEDSISLIGDSFEAFDGEFMSNSTNGMIREFADIYCMNFVTVEKIYNDNRAEIEASENPKKTFIVMVKNYFYQTSIDKTPIVSSKTREEKEAYIIHMAKDIYGIEDRELLALILAIHRLETGNSTSRRCIYDNNLGGVTDAHGFLTFKTFEIGAECFVRTVYNRVTEAYASPYYDWDLPIEYNIQEVYCDSSWGPQINPIKVDILNSGELDKYFNDKQKVLKK